MASISEREFTASGSGVAAGIGFKGSSNKRQQLPRLGTSGSRSYNRHLTVLLHSTLMKIKIHEEGLLLPMGVLMHTGTLWSRSHSAKVKVTQWKY